MKIKVLGTGCAKCKTLEKMTRETIAELGIEAEVEKVEDIIAIMGYGVMTTPALVIDEKVVLSGNLPSIPKLKELLTTK
ncbi:MAG: thioredoxin family protein [Bacteroidales bacterium]